MNARRFWGDKDSVSTNIDVTKQGAGEGRRKKTRGPSAWFSAHPAK